MESLQKMLTIFLLILSLFQYWIKIIVMDNYGLEVYQIRLYLFSINSIFLLSIMFLIILSIIILSIGILKKISFFLALGNTLIFLSIISFVVLIIEINPIVGTLSEELFIKYGENINLVYYLGPGIFSVLLALILSTFALILAFYRE